MWCNGIAEQGTVVFPLLDTAEPTFDWSNYVDPFLLGVTIPQFVRAPSDCGRK